MLNMLKVKELCSEKKIPMIRVAEQLGLTQQSMSKMLRENSTKISTLEKIAEILGVPVGYFFDDYDKKKKDKGSDDPALKKSEELELLALRERVKVLEASLSSFENELVSYRYLYSNLIATNGMANRTEIDDLRRRIENTERLRSMLVDSLEDIGSRLKRYSEQQ